jgi:hypothetical protein
MGEQVLVWVQQSRAAVSGMGLEVRGLELAVGSSQLLASKLCVTLELTI